MSAAEIGMCRGGFTGRSSIAVSVGHRRFTVGEFRGEREIGEDYLAKREKEKRKLRLEVYHKDSFFSVLVGDFLSLRNFPLTWRSKLQTKRLTLSHNI